MKKNPLIGAAREELEKTEFNPFRNAKLRVTSDANGRFRTIVEELLHGVNYGKISGVEALKQMIHADAKVKNDLMEAKEIIEKQMGFPFEGSVSEQRKYLIDNYESDDWSRLNSEIFANILSKIDESLLSDSSSELEREDENKTINYDREPKHTVNKDELEERFAELDQLIGLTKAKETIHQHFDLLVGYNQLLKKRGIPTVAISLHMVFKGNPGTGKTTVANLVAQIYKEMGILSKGHLVVAERADLVGAFIGQTEEKTKEVIKSALGGVLFIDEAYSLFVDDHNEPKDYGHQVINTLVKAMEEYRDDFVVIVAGYGKEMDAFLKSNPGLASRFSTYIEFEDYSGEELYSICKYMLTNRNLIISEKADEMIYVFCEELYENRKENFGNARDIRNFVDKICIQLGVRIMNNPDHEKLDDTELITVLDEDVRNTVFKHYPSMSAALEEGSTYYNDQVISMQRYNARRRER